MRKLTPPRTRTSFPLRQFWAQLDGSIAVLVFGATTLAFASSASWLLNPGTGDWNTAGNWNPATIPNAAADTATFATSNLASVSVTANTEVNSIVFNAGASAFFVTAQPTSTLTLSGAGITNNSGITQTLVTAVNGAGVTGRISFTGSANAGSQTAFFNNGGTVNGTFGGATRFFGTSNAGSGTFIANGGAVSRPRARRDGPAPRRPRHLSRTQAPPAPCLHAGRLDMLDGSRNPLRHLPRNYPRKDDQGRRELRFMGVLPARAPAHTSGLGMSSAPPI